MQLAFQRRRLRKECRLLRRPSPQPVSYCWRRHEGRWAAPAERIGTDTLGSARTLIFRHRWPEATPAAVCVLAMTGPEATVLIDPGHGVCVNRTHGGLAQFLVVQVWICHANL